MLLRQRLGADAKASLRAGPVALQEHVRAVRQAVQLGTAVCGAQIDQRRQLATAGVGDGRDVGQVRAVDQQHVGAIGLPGNAPIPGRPGCG